MNNFRVPPLTPSSLTPQDVLAERLKPLLGAEFRLTLFPRTNGSKIRKLIAETLATYDLPVPCPKSLYTIVPTKGKGVLRNPARICRYLYCYNRETVQPPSMEPEKAALVEYESGEKLATNEVRYVLVRVDPDEHYIRSILILSPEYIETRFGPFGKETTKQQLVITAKQRELIVQQNPPVLLYQNTPLLAPLVSHRANTPHKLFRDKPVAGELLALEVLWSRLYVLIGTKLDTGDTKTRGQALERLVAQLLGYSVVKDELLLGGYLDILNQLLEIKVQEASTVDLGRYSPQVREAIPSFPQATTEDVRYLIALVDKSTGIITGLVLCPGSRLGDHFSYVATGNYKCQRNIPMAFFDRYEGQVLYNPHDY